MQGAAPAKKINGKAVPVIGSGGMLGSETPRLLYFLDKQLRDVGYLLLRLLRYNLYQ
jgi:hypothetical protein